MSLAIVGLGTAVPPTAVSRAEGQLAAQHLSCHTAEQVTWLDSIYANAGVDTRHLVLGKEIVRDFTEGTRASGSIFLPSGSDDDLGPTTAQRLQQYRADAAPLALRAARQALKESGLTAQQITHIITVSCTGFHAPGVDAQLIEALGLSPETQRTHVGFMGCHGALNGLRVANAFVDADPAARVLLCAVELCSLHYYYQWDPQRIIANALFADGAAAVVGIPSSIAPNDAWTIRASGSRVFPDSADAMTWTVGDHGFAMTLSRRVPSLIAEHLRPWLTTWLARSKLTIEDIGSWAIHPGGPKILDAVEEALALPRASGIASREVFAEYGNMSSPTVLFILERLRSGGAGRPCVALGFGPGLTVEAMLVR